MVITESPLRIVLAPDSFKGSADATEVARAVDRGWRSVRPDDVLRLMPMADGGEGTLDAFELAVPGARRVPATVLGPDGRSVDTGWLLLPDGTGVVELAATSGITLLDPLLPFDAHTFGFGQAIASALDFGVSRLLLAIGGSSSTDGGAGALAALGARFLDDAGLPIPLGNRGLERLHGIDTAGLRALPPGGVRILSDVTSPLLGAAGAAAVFGPQKGADAAAVLRLEAGLRVLARQLDADPAAPGAGAAGGTGFGLLAWGAEMAPGSAAVGEALGLPAVLAEADIAVTGEGRFDAQSSAGKVPSYVAELIHAAGGRAMLVAGSVAAPTDRFAAAVSLVQLAGGLDVAIAEPIRWLEKAGSALALAATAPFGPEVACGP